MAENITLYAYLNIDHPMVAWEVAIGRIRSPSEIREKGFGVSLWQYQKFYKYAKEDSSKEFINELKLEVIRRNSYPNQVSRLQGVYFFESEELANIAVERWGVPGRKKYISKVYFSASALTRVDSEWITSYLRSEDDSWMRSYWKGEALGVEPLTEVLASGIGTVDNRDLRIQAYKNIINLWPTSTPLLAIACCAFAHKKMQNVAPSIPLITNKNGLIQGCFYIDMHDFDTREGVVAEALEECKRSNEVPPMIFPEDQTKFFTVPDLRNYNFSISNEMASKIFASIQDVSS